MTRRATGWSILIISVVVAVVIIGSPGMLQWSAQGRGKGTGLSASGCYRYSVQTSQWIYRHDQPVRLIVTRTNITEHECAGRTCGGVTPWFEVSNLAGAQVYHSFPAGVACARPVHNPPPVPEISPGRSEVWRDDGWDHSICTQRDCPVFGSSTAPGLYRITWHWLDAIAVQSNWLAVVS
jgi:hypothetical protein